MYDEGNRPAQFQEKYETNTQITIKSERETGIAIQRLSTFHASNASW